MTTSVSVGSTLNRIEWADAYFTASADKEPFEDVHIVTAKSVYLDLAYTAAADIVYNTYNRIISDEVFKVAHRLMDEKKIHVQEHVKVSEEGISVCINATNINDDDVMWRGLDMLADALHYLNGSQGTVYFNNPLHFSSSEIQWATTH